MAQILIRNLPDSTKATLRERAARHGRSMEAEARSILVDVIAAGENDLVLEWIDAAAEVSEQYGADLPEPPLRAPSRQVPEL